MITIGPWWLYDLAMVGICAFIIMASVKKGLFVGLYFLIFAVVIYLILTFIPQILTNLLSVKIEALLRKTGIYNSLQNALSGLDGIIGNGFEKVLTDFGMDLGTLSFSNFSDELVNSFVSLIIYLIFFFILFSTLFALMFIIYRFIKYRLMNANINRYVSSLCGAFFGCVIAILVASIGSFILSLPIFDYSSQRFGFPIKEKNDSNSEANSLADLIKSKNQFSKYALSSKFDTFLPYSTATFSYSTSCGYKYIITPLISAVTIMKSKDENGKTNQEKMQDIFGIFSNTFLEGYASDNIFDLPIKQAIQVLLTESQPVVRLISELVLDSGVLSSVEIFSKSKDDGVAQMKRGQAGVLFQQMDKYMEAHNMKKLNKKFDRKSFDDFFNATKANNTNQFVKSVEYLKANNYTKGYESLEKIFTDADSTYNFMENAYQVNTNTSTLSSIPNLISVFTSLYLMPGLELVPSGLTSAIFGETWLDKDSKFDYNFKIRDYMGFINE